MLFRSEEEEKKKLVQLILDIIREEEILLIDLNEKIPIYYKNKCTTILRSLFDEGIIYSDQNEIIRIKDKSEN